LDYICSVSWLIIFSQNAGGANTLTRYVPFKVTFEFTAKEGELFSEIFWAASARQARAKANVNGPGFIVIHSVEEVIS